MGEIAALCTALCWAVAARMFRVLGNSFTPLTLNLWKGLAALLILLPLTAWYLPAVILSSHDMLWLALSGAIGIGFGDTFFFQSLNKIGDSQSILVVETLAPIFTALLAMAFIAEWLSWQQWLGIALVIFSVDMVVKYQKRSQLHLFEMSGYLYAVLAALCQAVGVVISRDVLTRTDINPANASQWRLLGGLAIIVLLIVIRHKPWLPVTQHPAKTWKLFALATLIGTFAALFLQMLALQHAKAAVVQTLFATSVILSLLVALAMGEKVNRHTLSWSLLALAGVTVMILY